MALSRCGRVAAAGSTVRLDAGDQLSLPPCCPDSRRDFVGAEEDEFADAYWSFFAVLLVLRQHAAMTTPSSPPVPASMPMQAERGRGEELTASLRSKSPANESWLSRAASGAWTGDSLGSGVWT